MFRSFLSGIWLALLWAILTFASLAMRPLIPVDETRYAAVAWEMWLRNDFLVPHLNGETYSHKPPLLFWLMQLSWWLLGVNDWSLRLISPLFALGCLYLIRVVAGQLWPERRRVAEIAPFILISFFIWIFFSTLTMFDILLTFFALAGIASLLKLIRDGFSYQRWLLFGMAIGGGALSKGPVILLHVLPVALLAPWWLKSEKISFCWRQWYLGILLAIVTGAAIALSWAIPAGLSGGEVYRKAIFLGQTRGRLVESFAHRLPWWWYLQMLPVLVLPWLFVKPIWSGFRLLTLQDSGIRFCLAWALPVFLAFSVISGKRIHYLLPLMPVLALLIARAAGQTADSNWRRAHGLFAGIAGLLGLAAMLLPSLNGRFQWREELSEISPLWGAALLSGCLLIGLRKAGDIRESITYIAIIALLTGLFAAGGYFANQGYRYDTAPPAQQLAALIAQNKPVAVYTNKYHGQFNFTGRLTRPLTVLSSQDELKAYVGQHPEVLILVTYKDLKGIPDSIFSYSYPSKNKKTGIIPGKTLLQYTQIKLY